VWCISCSSGWAQENPTAAGGHNMLIIIKWYGLQGLIIIIMLIIIMLQDTTCWALKH
jgi:hypothetical protein